MATLSNHHCIHRARIGEKCSECPDGFAAYRTLDKATPHIQRDLDWMLRGFGAEDCAARIRLELECLNMTEEWRR